MPPNSARDILQVSYRCRSLTNSKIKIAYDAGIPPTNDINNDGQYIADPIYGQLFNDVLKEKAAPLKESIDFFCCKAGYSISKSPKDIADSLKKEMNHLFTGSEEEYPWEDVIDIADDDALRIYQNKLYGQTATLADKLAVQKYYFKQQFIDGTQLDEAWRLRYFNFFNILEDISSYGINGNAPHLLDTIKVHNKWSSICPSDQELKHVQLTREILDKAFGLIHFKFISTDSSHKVIVKRIYNTIFGRSIIESECDGNKHYNLLINEDTKSMFHLGLNNLRVFQQSPIMMDEA